MIDTIALAALSLLTAHLVTIGLYFRRQLHPPVGSDFIGQPPVTLLRPVCGREAFDRETLESSFTQDYPDYEIIFCVPADDDPAAPLIRELMAAHPGRKAQLLTSERAVTRNPKLNNLWQGWQAASAEWICMADSNLLLPPSYLRTIVSVWDERTGLVSSPPIGERPDGLAGSLECAFLNSNQARLQLASDSLGRGFAQGKTLFWKRELLDQAGGIEAIGNYLAEDVNATKLVRGAGLKVRLTPLPFVQPIGRRSFAQVWRRQLRWSRVRRDGFPWLFAGEILNGPLVPLVLVALTIWKHDLSFGLLPAFAAIWYGSEYWLMRRAGWPSGWRDLLALPIRDVLLPALWVATFTRRDIEWRGNSIKPIDGDDEKMAPALVDHD